MASHQRHKKEHVPVSPKKASPSTTTGWRSIGKDGAWTKEYAVKLMAQIRSITTIKVNRPEIKTVQNVHILLVGEIASGKSSFLNTVASIDLERIAQVTVDGSAEASGTHRLTSFRPRNKLKGFRLHDTMGFEKSGNDGINIDDYMFLIKGHVPKNYQFNPESPISETTKGFIETPELRDRMHCVVFVMNAGLLAEKNVPVVLIRKIRELQTKIQFEDIPRIVLLTKIDAICDEVRTDITKTYENEALGEAVRMTSELFMLPEKNIFPVQNYTYELENDHLKEILHLQALRQMVHFATDHLNKLLDDSDDDEEQNENK